MYLFLYNARHNAYDNERRSQGEILSIKTATQRNFSQSSQRSDLDNFVASKSSYENSDNECASVYSNPYDLMPPSVMDKNNPNLKLDMKSVNVINHLKEENLALKIVKKFSFFKW